MRSLPSRRSRVPPVAGVIVCTDDVRMIAPSLVADSLECVLRAIDEVADMARVVTGELPAARER